MNTDQKIIKNKVGLLNLADMLGLQVGALVAPDKIKPCDATNKTSSQPSQLLFVEC